MYMYMLQIVEVCQIYNKWQAVTNRSFYHEKSCLINEAITIMIDFMKENDDLIFSDDRWREDYHTNHDIDMSPIEFTLITFNVNTCKIIEEEDITDNVVYRAIQIAN